MRRWSSTLHSSSAGAATAAVGGLRNSRMSGAERCNAAGAPGCCCCCCCCEAATGTGAERRGRLACFHPSPGEATEGWAGAGSCPAGDASGAATAATACCRCLAASWAARIFAWAASMTGLSSGTEHCGCVSCAGAGAASTKRARLRKSPAGCRAASAAAANATVCSGSGGRASACRAWPCCCCSSCFQPV